MLTLYLSAIVSRVSFFPVLYISRQLLPAIPAGLRVVVSTLVSTNLDMGIFMVVPILKFVSLSPGLALVISFESMLYFFDMEYRVSLGCIV